MQSLLGAIGRHCAETGQTRKQLASSIGVSTTAFRRKCDGRNPWRLNEAKTIADALSIDLDEFYSMVKSV